MAGLLTHDEVLALATCPFCQAPKGAPCTHPSTGLTRPFPHPSRTRQAADTSEGAR